MLENLVGKKFDRLRVIGFAGKGPANSRMWWCRCKCGTVIKARTALLNIGGVRSCGCLQRDKARKNAKKMVDANRTHGLSKTSEYNTWSNMIRRCTNPQTRGYRRYGGRGIKVCKRWLKSFEAFLEDMGPKPSPKHSIARINNDGHYTPNNCEWGTKKEQDRNKCSNLNITYKGKTQCLTDWAAEFGMTVKRLHARIKRWGSFEKAVETPLKCKEPVRLEYNGQSKTLAEWCRELGIPYNTAAYRLSVGKSAREALARK